MRSSKIGNTLAILAKKAGGKRAPVPEVRPMLATRINEPFDDEDFVFEVKWDGYRIIAYKTQQGVNLLSRESQNFTSTYSPITQSLNSINHTFIIDGEVIMLDKDGKPSFDLLQNVKRLGTDRLVYCVFDLLWIDGYDLTMCVLLERKKILSELLNSQLPHIFLGEYTVGDGKLLFSQMQEQNLEGIVAKRKDSFYYPGQRSKDWLKIQTRMRQEFVIGGWTESESGRPFRSLVFGYYKGKKLIYFGHSGGGYTDKSAATLKKELVGSPGTELEFAL